MPSQITSAVHTTEQINRFVRESLQDPDLVGRTEDFKAGYAKGMREALVVFAAMLYAK